MSTMSTIESNIDLRCPICKKDLRQPKQLGSCYHIFCGECLKQHMDSCEDGKADCPTCHTKCPKESIPNFLDMITPRSVENADTSINDGRNLAPDLPEEAERLGADLSEEAEARPGGNLPEKEYQCPICRNTTVCDYKTWLYDLRNEEFKKNDQCIEHDTSLNAYCNTCEEILCEICCMIEHKDHKTVLINRVRETKLSLLDSLTQYLASQQKRFAEAAQDADNVQHTMNTHIDNTQQELKEREGHVQREMDKTFDKAFQMIRQTGKKQMERNKQQEEMHQEEEFFNTAIRLARYVSHKDVTTIEIVRVWKGLNFICEGLKGGRVHTADMEPREVTPQQLVEQRLVLPSINCMMPDLCVLGKIGLESTVLRKSFMLRLEQRLLLSYSILPVTEAEALLSCKTDPGVISIVQYSNDTSHRHSIGLQHGGQYNMTAVPGRGIVATLYQEKQAKGWPEQEKRQILFWDQALDRCMTGHEAAAAADEFKLLSKTELPPLGVAVTRDNHLVVLTEDEHKCSIILMTMKGSVIKQKDVPTAGSQLSRYITVNINDDVCVTDEKKRAVLVFDRDLKPLLQITNPYPDGDKRNRRFSPRGICHDSFGRLLVADGNNHCVIRFKLTHTSAESEVILQKGVNKLEDFTYPTLVALGPQLRLWVVCRENIHVFYYMDKE